VSGTITEAEWLAGQAPHVLLRTVTGRGRSRRLRLCAVACCRLVAHLLPDDRCRRAIDVAEEYADRRATKEQLRLASDETDDVIAWHEGLTTCGAAARLHAAGAVRFATDSKSRGFAAAALLQAAAATAFSQFPAEEIYRPQDPKLTEALGEEERAQAVLIRDVLRNPFLPAPSIPASLPAPVLSVAQAAYDERLPSFDLDPVRLSVLADALEDAGCSDEAILDHLRSAGPHVRGCWALDLVLGKP
jgi:hypothetical protein